MKTNKLYTLSQFVDLMDNMTVNEITRFLGTPNYHRLIPMAIFKYNNFLKQPLKKEMFVNEHEYPDESLSGGFATNEEQNEFDDALILWRQAEKKVIFKGAEIINEDLFQLPNGTLVDFHNGKCLVYDTLHDLAEATKGQLELKNVEL